MTTGRKSVQQMNDLRAKVAQDELMLVRQAFRERGYDTDDAIRAIAHRVVEQSHTGGSKTWTLDGVVVLRLGPIQLVERADDGKISVTLVREVAFS